MATDPKQVISGLMMVTADIPPPAGPIIAAILELGLEALELEQESAAARIQELRAMLRAGITATVQEELNK